MGIPGLMSQVKKSPQCYRPVDIAQEVQRAKRRLGNKEPMIVVDMMSCLRTMYGELPWIFGGQLKEFVSQVEKFANQFTSLGVELVFYIDGSLDEAKVGKWMKSKKSRINDVQNVFSNIRRGVENAGRRDILVLPQNLGFSAILALRRCGCQVIRSVDDCDLEIARYARRENCLAVMASDSDFIIFPGTWQFWALDDLNLDKMTTMAFDKTKFASNLGIDICDFPILASLLGNDVIERYQLSAFYRRCRMDSRFPQSGDIANFMRRCSYINASKIDPKSIAEAAHLTGRAKELFFESLHSYDVEAPAKEDHPSGDPKWDAICKMMRDRHIAGKPLELYGSAVKGLYTYPHSLEEYRRVDEDEKRLPPNQQVTLTLRRKIYGILLFEKPPKEDVHCIRELVVTGPKSLDQGPKSISAIMPKTSHPGLQELWSESKKFDRERWALLCEPMGIDPDVLHRSSIPGHLYALTLALKYLIDEGVDLDRGELAAIVASAVMVKRYSIKRIKCIEIPKLTPRSVQLATIVFQTCRFILVLNAACGYPITEDEADPANFQDGKLFQQAFCKVNPGKPDIENLCEKEQDRIVECHAILDLLCAKDINANPSS